MDKIDREIIECLRRDARLSYRELGEQVNLSANTVADRVRRLLSDGVLKGFTAQVDLAALDFSLQALIDVKMLPTTTAAHFENVISSIRGVTEVMLMTGTYDYVLKVACIDHTDLVRLIEDLRARAGVQDTHSRVILRQLVL